MTIETQPDAVASAQANVQTNKQTDRQTRAHVMGTPRQRWIRPSTLRAAGDSGGQQGKSGAFTHGHRLGDAPLHVLAVSVTMPQCSALICRRSDVSHRSEATAASDTTAADGTNAIRTISYGRSPFALPPK